MSRSSNLHTAEGIRQLPGEGKDIPSHGLENFRNDRVGGVGGLMKVCVDAAADDGDGRDTNLFEWHVIAAWEKSVHVRACRCSPAVLSRF